MRSIPSAVFGPVLSPPCNRHRPFGIAGHRHGVPRRFFAPQRAAFEKSPGGLAFLRVPRRFSWGVSAVFRTSPHPLPRPFCRHRPNNCLPTIVDVDVLNHDTLLTDVAAETL
jgi:hypothetical protein